MALNVALINRLYIHALWLERAVVKELSSYVMSLYFFLLSFKHVRMIAWYVHLAFFQMIVIQRDILNSNLEACFFLSIKWPRPKKNQFNQARLRRLVNAIINWLSTLRCFLNLRFVDNCSNDIMILRNQIFFQFFCFTNVKINWHWGVLQRLDPENPSDSIKRTTRIDNVIKFFFKK